MGVGHPRECEGGVYTLLRYLGGEVPQCRRLPDEGCGKLLAFYEFPAAYWGSLQATNPIESTFATIRMRTAKTRNCLSEKTALSLVHQPAMSAEKR